MAEYEWIVVAGAVTAFIAAFGIGANDVANAFATSVGSKAITIRQACFLAVVFEVSAARVLLGSHVTRTIRKGIADADCFAGPFGVPNQTEDFFFLAAMSLSPTLPRHAQHLDEVTWTTKNCGTRAADRCSDCLSFISTPLWRGRR